MKDDDQINSLIAGGLIGAALGALLSKNSDQGAIVGAIVGAALSATLKASEEASKMNVPLFVEEDGSIYEVQSGGNKRFVKKIDKPVTKLPRRFKLK